ncbi:hypothetical protein H6P81_018120 [Aristolochia fimbriata]|uniref:Aminotransferase-like plant mobile domain-containing protein n=1 Tax=Aristolochia fimbriata TaxID=158543 RepID=A0AAV7E1L4_ARIFI|nr:hypothetical protein H6P81_018120 [Aristolochia fimbriata]
MAAPYVNVIGGLRAFDHDVTVGNESVLTLALYMEGDASRRTYCPSGESIFGGHAVKRPPLVDRSLPYGSLSRPLATGEHVFFLPCLDSFEDKDVAAGPETFALKSALRVVNQPPLPRTLAEDFLDRGIVQNLHSPDTTLDTPIPFLFEWTTLLMGRCSCILYNAVVYFGLWASIFQYSCDASVVQAFLDAWSPETNTLITCQGELSIALLDMDRIFSLPISGQFYDEVSPMVADFKDVRSSALPYNCQYLFLAYHRLCRSLESHTLSTASWGGATSRERTAIEQDVFDILHVMPSKEDEVHWAALLSVWLSRFVFHSTGGDDLRPTVFKVASYMVTGIRFALAGPALACLYRALSVRVVGLICPCEESRLETPRPPLLIILGGKNTCPHDLRSTGADCFRCCGSSGEEEDYDSDRSHPHRRRPKGKQQIGSSSANKKRAPLTTLNDASASKKKARVEAQHDSLPSPSTFFPPTLEMEPPHSSPPQTSCPPVLEMGRQSQNLL